MAITSASGWCRKVGVPGVWMLLLLTAICFFIYLSASTVVWLRKVLSLSFLKRAKAGEADAAPVVETSEEDDERVPEKDDRPRGGAGG